MDEAFRQAQEAILSDGLGEMEDLHDATIGTYADFGKIFCLGDALASQGICNTSQPQNRLKILSEVYTSLDRYPKNF